MSPNTPGKPDEVNKNRTSQGALMLELKTERGGTEIALMKRSLESHGIDISLLRVGSKLCVELSNEGITFSLRINEEGVFEVTESSDTRLPVGTIYTDLTEQGFSNRKTRMGTPLIHKITMI
ncbi:hypothetical protein KA057_01620 [Candidatus Gracilibacteria bacterium]|nr:hypothetical protein [Candidatus Gracilibacteria bacterium]